MVALAVDSVEVGKEAERVVARVVAAKVAGMEVEKVGEGREEDKVGERCNGKGGLGRWDSEFVFCWCSCGRSLELCPLKTDE